MILPYNPSWAVSTITCLLPSGLCPWPSGLWWATITFSTYSVFLIFQLCISQTLSFIFPSPAFSHQSFVHGQSASGGWQVARPQLPSPPLPQFCTFMKENSVVLHHRKGDKYVIPTSKKYYSLPLKERIEVCLAAMLQLSSIPHLHHGHQLETCICIHSEKL